MATSFVPRLVSVALAGLVVGGIVVAAFAHLLVSPSDVLRAPHYATVAARQGSVERTIVLNASLSWVRGDPVPHAGSGVLTALSVSPERDVQAGDVVATVDLRPVVIAQGSTPMFRSLARGAQGPDVAQLQHLLAARGHLDGPPDGTYRASTVEAVKRWQRSLAVEETGTVQPSDVVFAPALPGRFVPATDLRIGARLGDGAALITPLSTPVATLNLSEGQANLLEAGQRVTIAPGTRDWPAVVDEVTTRTDEASTTRVASLRSAGDGPLCADACHEIPVVGAFLLPARIEVVAPTAGVIVPASAITTDAAGATGVITAEGTAVAVTVRASTGGEVVVDGLDADTVVRAPALVAQAPPR